MFRPPSTLTTTSSKKLFSSLLRHHNRLPQNSPPVFSSFLRHRSPYAEQLENLSQPPTPSPPPTSQTQQQQPHIFQPTFQNTTNLTEEKHEEKKNEKNEKQKKKKSLFRRMLRYGMLGLLTFLTFHTYRNTQLIIRAEHDLREWEPEMEREMPQVFRSQVLKQVGQLTLDVPLVEKLFLEFSKNKQLEEENGENNNNFSDKSKDDDEEWMEKKVTVEYVNMNTGVSTRALNSHFLELLKQCQLSVRIDYLITPIVKQDVSMSTERFGVIGFLRLSQMNFDVPVRISLQKVYRSNHPDREKRGTVVSEEKLIGFCRLTFVRYKDMVPDASWNLGRPSDVNSPNTNTTKNTPTIERVKTSDGNGGGGGSNPLLPPRDDWYLFQHTFRPIEATDAIVLNDGPSHRYFRMVTEGTRVFTYRKDDRLEFMEKNYVKFGGIKLFGSTTAVVKTPLPGSTAAAVGGSGNTTTAATSNSPGTTTTQKPRSDK